MSKLLSWNINGLISAYQKGGLSTILEEGYDYICLQEVKSDNIDLIKRIVPNYYNIQFNFSKQKGKNGVIVLSKEKPIDCSKLLGENKFDSQGRFLNLQYHDFRLINLYLPHGGRDKKNLDFKLESATIFLNLLKLYKNERIIIAADFNIAHKEIDVYNAKTNKKNIMFTNEERSVIDNLLELGFIDVYRHLYKDTINYSWWTYAFNCRERNIGWRIDYFFVANCLKDNIKDIKMLGSIYGSDHCPIELKLR